MGIACCLQDLSCVVSDAGHSKNHVGEPEVHIRSDHSNRVCLETFIILTCQVSLSLCGVFGEPPKCLVPTLRAADSETLAVN